MQTVKINAFKSRALKYSEDMLPDEDIKTDNITNLFYDQIPRILERGELINWQIFGEVTSGKSAVMAHLVNHINKHLNKPMTLKRIFADQIEFREYLQKEDEEKICVGIDEWNEMGTQGMNATTDEKFLTWTSDVMAQKYVHRISCSPETQVDRRATLLLEILGKDIKTKTTRCLVKYRIVTSEMIKPQLIGYIDICVGNILNKSWYKQYRKRKMDKITLVRSKGISDPRTIEQAGMLLDLINGLKEQAKIMTIDNGMISVKIEQLKRKNSLYLSLITTNELERRTHAILKTIGQIERNKTKALKLKRDNKWNEGKKLEEATQQMQDLIDDAIQEQIRLKQVYEEYRKI